MNSYRNHRFGGRLQPSVTWGSWIVRLIPSYRSAVEHELRYLPALWPGARLLDVGFGGGSFLALAKDVGWEIAGADTDPIVVNNALQRGLEVRAGGIEVYADSKGSFDALSMSHVIEHVHEPRVTLEWARKLLKPEGLLYVETPNMDALGHREFAARWRGLEPPRHLTMFTWDGLERLLNAAGFEVVRRIARPSLYSELAAASRARTDRTAFVAKFLGKGLHALKCVYAFLRVAGDYRRSEFITVVCKRI
jgi:SAM-dependent methyltransferase